MKSLTIASLALVWLLMSQPTVTRAETVSRQQSPSQLATVLKTDKTCNGRLEVGETRLLTVNGEQQLVIPLKNVTEHPLTVATKTAFLRKDGSVIVNDKPAGGLEGITRGFIGVVSFGISEAAMQDRDASVITMQDIAPGQAVEVVHRLPANSGEPASVETVLAIVPGSQELANQHDIRRQYDIAFQEVRNEYAEQRKDEFDRWYALKDKLQARKKASNPMSADYRQLIDEFWNEHQAHMNRLDQIEQGFAKLEAKQQQLVDNALAQAKTFTN